jgi:DNA-binding response OmpR family regulator
MKCYSTIIILKNIPNIFISALTSAKDEINVFSFSNTDYLAKPFQFEEVEARVATTAARIFKKNRNAIFNSIHNTFGTIIANDYC